MFSQKLKIGDLVLILSIILISVILLGVLKLKAESTGSPSKSIYATIKIDNKVYKTVQLTEEPQLIEVRTDRGYDILSVHDKGIEVIESDCPEKICFSFGLITKSNETIICLPLRMVIEISGQQEDSTEDEIDVIVR